MRRVTAGAAIVAAAAVLAAVAALFFFGEWGDGGDALNREGEHSSRLCVTNSPPPSVVAGTSDSARRAIDPAAGGAAPAAAGSSGDAEIEWTGFVVNGDQQGIAGVRVELLRGEIGQRGAAESLARETTTDEHGQFRIDTTGGTMLLARKAGYASACADLGRTSPVVITLVPGASLVGRVLADLGDAPLAGASVLLRAHVVPEFATRAVTDAAGAFRFEGIEVDRPGVGTEFVIQAPGAFPVSDSVEFDAPREYARDFRIPQEPVLRGRVIDLMTRAPVGDVDVIPEGYGGYDFSVVTRSRDDGSFEIRGAPTDFLVAGVAVSKVGYAGSHRDFFGRNQRAETDPICEMGVLAMCVLEGTVTGTDGSPVADAAIFTGLGLDAMAVTIPVQLPTGLILGTTRAFSTRTASDGTYRLEGLVPWVRYAFLQLHTPHLHLTRDLPSFAEPGETRRLDWIAIEATAVVHGEITVNGNPIDAAIGWSSAEHRAFGDNAVRKTGLFRFENVPAGTIQIHYRPADHFEQITESIEVAAGAELRHDIRITLDLSQIRGVVDIDGLESKAGVKVIATRKKPKARVECETVADGSFVLRLPDEVWAEWMLGFDETRFKNAYGADLYGVYPGATGFVVSGKLR